MPDEIKLKKLETITTYERLVKLDIREPLYDADGNEIEAYRKEIITLQDALDQRDIAKAEIETRAAKVADLEAIILVASEADGDIETVKSK